MSPLPDLSSLSPEKRALLQKKLAERGLIAGPRQDTIRARGDGSPAPLSYLQEGLWFLDQLTPGQATYNVPMTARIRGPLQVEALETALQAVYQRHESLRTTFKEVNGEVKQVILPENDFSLRFIDLQDRTDAEEEGLRLAAAEARRPMNLETGPLFRASLVRLAAEDHLLLITIHHIITDGWSMGVLTRELTALYSAAVQKKPPSLPPLPIQFGDYAAWQRSRLQGEALENLLSFWRSTLAGHSFVLQLPTDHDRPPVQSGRGGHLSFTLSKDVSSRLREISRSENITLFAMMLAVFYVFLSEWTGENDLIVGTPVANRQVSWLENLIGYFVNQLPLRARLQDDLTLRDFARQVHATIVAASEHQELPFRRLVEELQPARDPARNPIFQVEFSLLDPTHAPPVYGYGFSAPVDQTITFQDLTMTPVETESGASKFDLTVLLWDMDAGISGTFEYDADLFESDTIGRLVEYYGLLLKHSSAKPEITTLELKHILAARIRSDRNRERQARRSRQSGRIRALKRRPRQ